MPRHGPFSLRLTVAFWLEEERQLGTPLVMTLRQIGVEPVLPSCWWPIVKHWSCQIEPRFVQTLTVADLSATRWMMLIPSIMDRVALSHSATTGTSPAPRHRSLALAEANL